jgi:hypothetical protein
VRTVNLILRFLLELCALAALSYGGWHTPAPTWLRILLAIGSRCWRPWCGPAG